MLDAVLSRLTFSIKLPMPIRVVVWRIENRLFEELIGHTGDLFTDHSTLYSSNEKLDELKRLWTTAPEGKCVRRRGADPQLSGSGIGRNRARERAGVESKLSGQDVSKHYARRGIKIFET